MRLRLSPKFVTVFLLLSFLSCKENRTFLEPDTNISYLQKDFMNWWNYQSNSIRLAGNFVALNEKEDVIGKEEFLHQLTSGKFIPIQLKSKDQNTYYKLYKIEEKAPISIRNTIKSNAITELKFYKMEGVDFPKFNWTDLQGNSYTSKNTQGKILVVKCWFINCYACIKEFPDLNVLVNKYKNRTDIEFISLALDNEDQLKDFLKEHNFNYQVVPDQSDYLKNDLNIKYYPTHIIINKEGKVLKVVTNFEDLNDVMKYDLEPQVKN